MDNGSQLSAKKEERDGAVVLTLEGVINERTNLDDILQDTQPGKLIINLRGITRINSCGVRDWVNAIRKLAGKNEIEYVECSRAIVDQLIMITNFLQPGRIVSFYAPYHCEECAEPHEALINISEHFDPDEDFEDAEAPEFECPKCGKVMEFAEDESAYFFFLSEE